MLFASVIYNICHCYVMRDPYLSILQVFGALCQLEFGREVWERILYQAFELLTNSTGDHLVAAMTFVFKAASHSQHLPQAVCLVST